MRDLIVTENITLDGVIEATEAWFAPAGGEDDVSDVEAALLKQREAADALLLGRVTFEQMRGYWPLRCKSALSGGGYGMAEHAGELARPKLRHSFCGFQLIRLVSGFGGPG